jgi:hypothetical protein
MRQAAYRRKVGDGRCPACLDPSFPGGATCAYHRRESQLRTQAWQLTRRGLSTAEVDAQRQALRARWQALRAAHVDPWLLAEAMFG